MKVYTTHALCTFFKCGKAEKPFKLFKSVLLKIKESVSFPIDSFGYFLSFKKIFEREQKSGKIFPSNILKV